METLEEIEQDLATKCSWCLGTGGASYWCTWCGGSGLERTRGTFKHIGLVLKAKPAPYLNKETGRLPGAHAKYVFVETIAPGSWGRTGIETYFGELVSYALGGIVIKNSRSCKARAPIEALATANLCDVAVAKLDRTSFEKPISGERFVAYVTQAIECTPEAVEYLIAATEKAPEP